MQSQVDRLRIPKRKERNDQRYMTFNRNDRVGPVRDALAGTHGVRVNVGDDLYASAIAIAPRSGHFFGGEGDIVMLAAALWRHDVVHQIARDSPVTAFNSAQEKRTGLLGSAP